MADQKKINKILASDGIEYEINAKYWGGHETSDIKTINGVSIFGKGDITLLSVGITYSELKSLRDNSKLVPGQQYRITDYVTTTTQSDTQSAGHQFDIIVTADDVNVLNENARAIQHEGDTYFTNSDLNAWEVKYCLDNDTDRFAWADDSEDYTINLPLSDSIRNLLQQSFGSNAYIPGVITFKYWNHKFNDPNCEEWIGIDYYAAINVKLPGDDRLLIAYPHGTKLYSNIAFSETLSTAFNNDIAGNCFFINGQPIPDLGPIDTLPTVLIEEKGKGVIYYMKDEFNNECPYDFKNIQFRHPNDTDTYPDYYYTFTWIDENYDIMDTSIFGNNGTLTCYGEIYGVYSNVIKPYMGMIYDEDSDEYLGTKQLLNSIIFISDYKYEGGNDGFFGCSGNSFGNDCYNNSFGNNCYNNSFGNECSRNSFGNECYRNSFGNYCSDNSFVNDCSTNSFGNGCSGNSFGDYCPNNSFGNDCYDNSFGNDCSRNSFGNDCSRNSFGNYCSDNSFGNECYDNSFGNYCYGNSFGNECYDNSFGESSSNLKSYYRYIIFDNGNSYINLNCTSTTSTSTYYQNVRIGLGVNNIDADTYKTINDSNVGQTYETCYKPANSQTITI